MSHRRHSSRPTALKPNRKGGNGEISASMFVGVMCKLHHSNQGNSLIQVLSMTRVYEETYLRDVRRYVDMTREQ